MTVVLGILDAWKAQTEVTEGCWMFPAGFTRKKDHPDTLLDAAKMTPLSPANVLRDVVLPALEKKEIHWLGYHAFRRGLATNLRALDVDDLTISEVLRHNDVAVTRASYIKRVSHSGKNPSARQERPTREEYHRAGLRGADWGMPNVTLIPLLQDVFRSNALPARAQYLNGSRLPSAISCQPPSGATRNPQPSS
jgi:hypothetical protein